MAYQDWLTTWEVTGESNGGVTISSLLTFQDQQGSPRITCSDPGCCWNGVLATYVPWDDHVEGTTFEGQPFSICRTAGTEKDVLSCMIYADALFSGIEDPHGREGEEEGGGGGTWMAEEGSG